MRVFTKGRALIAVLGLAMASTAGAQAQSYDVTDFGSNKGVVINAVVNVPHHAGMSAYIGRTQLIGTDDTGSAFQFDTYCIDVMTPLQATTFTASDIASSGYDADRLTNVATFLEHTSGFTVDATTYAAVQIGVWEIMNETSADGWDTTSGKFYVSGHNATASDALANSWLASLAANDWKPDPTLRLQVLVPQGVSQTQVRLVPAAQSIVVAAPEPASWAMMVMGFGLAGMGMRRRRKTAATAAA